MSFSILGLLAEAKGEISVKFTAIPAEAEHKSRLEELRKTDDAKATIGIDTDTGGAGKKRKNEEAESGPAVRPAAKKMKATPGKAASPRVTKKKGGKEIYCLNEEVEHKPRKKPVSRTVSKTTAKDEKVEKKTAGVVSLGKKKPAMNKILKKTFNKFNGEHRPVMLVRMTAAQLTARKAEKK